jgi:hypothetical protein
MSCAEGKQLPIAAADRLFGLFRGQVRKGDRLYVSVRGVHASLRDLGEAELLIAVMRDLLIELSEPEPKDRPFYHRSPSSRQLFEPDRK